MTDDAKKVTRRGLLLGWALDGADREASPPPKTSGGFSIDAFYQKREMNGAASAPLPPFRLRADLASVPMTSIGTPELRSTSPRAEAGVPASPGPAPPPPRVMPLVNAGHLRINRSRCLAWQKSFCTTCSERCPEQGAILVDLGRPTVVDERCTRCGICVAVCPAPINAFEISMSEDDSRKAPR